MAAGDFIRSLAVKQQQAREQAEAEMVLPDPNLGFPPNTKVSRVDVLYRAKLLKSSDFEDRAFGESHTSRSPVDAAALNKAQVLDIGDSGDENLDDSIQKYSHGFHHESVDTLRRQVPRIDRQVQERYRILSSVTGETHPLPPVSPVIREAYGPRAWETLRQDDIRKNFLWREWQERVREEDPDSIEYDSWNEMVAGEAMLRLIAFFPKGRELLQTNFYRDHDKETVPTVEQVTRFIEDYHLFEGGDVAFGGGRFAVEETQLGSEGFLSLLYEAVPYSRRCIARILAGYRRLVVRSWAKDDAPAGSGEVPYANDPSYGAAQLVTWDGLVQALGHTEPGQDEKQERLENFVIGLYSQGMNRDEVLKRSGISRRQLYDILEKRGVPTRRKARKKQEATA